MEPKEWLTVETNGDITTFLEQVRRCILSEGLQEKLKQSKQKKKSS